jgi:hypothetical protein
VDVLEFLKAKNKVFAFIPMWQKVALDLSFIFALTTCQTRIPVELIIPYHDVLGILRKRHDRECFKFKINEVRCPAVRYEMPELV